MYKCVRQTIQDIIGQNGGTIILIGIIGYIVFPLYITVGIVIFGIMLGFLGVFWLDSSVAKGVQQAYTA